MACGWGSGWAGGQGAGHSRRSIAVNRETYDKQRETLVAAARAFRDDVPDVRFDWSSSCAHLVICASLAVLFREMKVISLFWQEIRKRVAPLIKLFQAEV